MTDEQMDGRLRRAGEAWRAANTIREPARGNGEPFVIGTERGPHHRHRWSLIASAAVVAAALVAGGAFLVRTGGAPPTSGPASSSLIGTRWSLVRITTANGRSVPVVGKAGFRIDHSERFSGAAGCTSVRGRADVRGHTIGFRDLMSDLGVFCRAELAAEERQVRAVLRGSTTWAIVGDRLTISKAGAGTLVYRDAATLALVGRTWRLSAAGRGLWSVTLTLRSDRTFEFDAYCLGRAGTYKLNGDLLELTTTGTFGIQRCGTGAARTATRDVDGTLQWSITNRQLKLTKGDTTLEFTLEGAATAATPLLGTAWTMSGYTTSRRLPHRDYGPVRGPTEVLTIDRIGYHLDSRCLDYTGRASARGSELVLGPSHPAGGRACASPAIDNEVAVLPGTYQWLIIGHRLYLSADDRTDIEFRSCRSTPGVCR